MSWFVCKTNVLSFSAVWDLDWGPEFDECFFPVGGLDPSILDAAFASFDVHSMHTFDAHSIDRFQEVLDFDLPWFQLRKDGILRTLLTLGTVRKAARLIQPVLITCRVSFGVNGIRLRSIFGKYVGSLLPKRKRYRPFTIFLIMQLNFKIRWSSMTPATWLMWLRCTTV